MCVFSLKVGLHHIWYQQLILVPGHSDFVVLSPLYLWNTVPLYNYEGTSFGFKWF